MKVNFASFLRDGTMICPRFESMNSILQKVDFVLNCLMFLVEKPIVFLLFSSSSSIKIRDSMAIGDELRRNPLYKSRSWEEIDDRLLRLRSKLRHSPCSRIDKSEFMDLLVCSYGLVHILRRQVDAAKNIETLAITQMDARRNGISNSINNWPKIKIIDTLKLAIGQIEDEYHTVYNQVHGLVQKARLPYIVILFQRCLFTEQHTFNLGRQTWPLSTRRRVSESVCHNQRCYNSSFTTNSVTNCASQLTVMFICTYSTCK